MDKLLHEPMFPFLLGLSLGVELLEHTGFDRLGIFSMTFWEGFYDLLSLGELQDENVKN